MCLAEHHCDCKVCLNEHQCDCKVCFNEHQCDCKVYLSNHHFDLKYAWVNTTLTVKFVWVNTTLIVKFVWVNTTATVVWLLAKLVLNEDEFLFAGACTYPRLAPHIFWVCISCHAQVHPPLISANTGQSGLLDTLPVYILKIKTSRGLDNLYSNQQNTTYCLPSPQGKNSCSFGSPPPPPPIPHPESCCNGWHNG